MAHDGAEITTVEGLADRKTDGSAANDEDGAGLHPLQDAFLAYDAFQCGYHRGPEGRPAADPGRSASG
jgi:xanthine dehydrogenase YagT iron-sulfur-binding subunit